MNKNQEIASKVLALVGNEENITNIFHCATRLRFNLRDNGLANLEEIQKIKGVMGTHVASGEVQVIIGPAVDDVYNEIIKLTSLEKMEKLEEDLDGGNKDFSVKGVFNSIINAFSACMNPLVPVFILLGVANLIAVLIGPVMLGIVAEDSNIYTNFYYIGQAIIYFLPVLIAVTAAKHFKANQYISLVLAFILLYPNLITLIGEGKYTVYGISVAAVTYSASVIPIMLIVLVQSYVEKMINKVIPNSLKVMLVPLLTVLAMLPLALCVLGPAGNYVGEGLATAIFWLREVAGPLETMIVAAFGPFMVAFGFGRPLFFICLTTLLTTGSEYAYMPIAMVIITWQIMGVALGYTIKSKRVEDKQFGLACLASVALGGVSEPTLFGIFLPNKKLYLPAIIGGALSGLYLGIMNVGLFQFGATNVLSVTGFIGGNSSNFLHGCIASGIAFIVTCALVLLTYKRDEIVK